MASRSDLRLPEKKLSNYLPTHVHSKKPRCIKTPPDSASSSTSLSIIKSHESLSSKDKLRTSINLRDLRFIRFIADDVIFSFHAPPTDDLIAELVTQCVVSARSAWLIRKFPKLSDRSRLYLELLSSLQESDVGDLLKRCPENKRWIEGVAETFQVGRYFKLDTIFLSVILNQTAHCIAVWTSL